MIQWLQVAFNGIIQWSVSQTTQTLHQGFSTVFYCGPNYNNEIISRASSILRAPQGASLNGWGPGARLRAPGGVQGQSPWWGSRGRSPRKLQVFRKFIQLQRMIFTGNLWQNSLQNASKKFQNINNLGETSTKIQILLTSFLMTEIGSWFLS